MKRMLGLVLGLMLLLGCAPGLAADITGRWEDNTYTNDFAGIAFHMPEDWWVYDQERVAQLWERDVSHYEEIDPSFDRALFASEEEETILAVSRKGINQLQILVVKSNSVDVPLYAAQDFAILESYGYAFDAPVQVTQWGHEYTLYTGTADTGFPLLLEYYFREQDGYAVVIFLHGHNQTELEKARACLE